MFSVDINDLGETSEDGNSNPGGFCERHADANSVHFFWKLLCPSKLLKLLCIDFSYVYCSLHVSKSDFEDSLGVLYCRLRWFAKVGNGGSSIKELSTLVIASNIFGLFSSRLPVKFSIKIPEITILSKFFSFLMVSSCSSCFAKSRLSLLHRLSTLLVR